MESAERQGNEKTELRQKLEATLEKAKEVCENLQNKTVNAAKATDEAVHEHPYQAMGIAFGLGVLIGVLAARSRRD